MGLLGLCRKGRAKTLRAWLIVLGAVFAATTSAKSQQSGIGIRDFSVTDVPCEYNHDSSVEKLVQSGTIVINTAEFPRASPVATFELRNNSAKTITAYVFNYTFTHGTKTDYFAGTGADLVYEMALAKSGREQSLPRSTFPPGGVVKQEIRGGGRHGQFEVFPCLVVFDDGTFVGPSSLWKFLRYMRANNAKAFGALVADLKLARDSADPKTFLMHRAKQLKKISASTSGEEPYRYLQIVASGLSQNGNSLLDRNTLNDHISALQAQRQMLVEQSAFEMTEK